MPDDTNSQGSEVEEVIVVVPEETAGASAPSGTGASTGETGTAPESGSVTEEVIEAVLDPLGVAGAGDGSGTATGAAEEVVVVEEVVVEEIGVFDAVANVKPSKVDVPPGDVTLTAPLLPLPTIAVIW